MRKAVDSVCIVSLGCSKNQVDSEVMSASLLREGFRFVSDPEDADVILLNTCSFIQEAVEESLTVLDALGRYREQGNCRCLVLAGCLVERYGRRLKKQLPYVDLFMGVKAGPRVGRILARRLRGDLPQSFLLRPPPDPGASVWNPGHHREALGVWAYVKIAEGCSNRCSYCTIPGIRGPLRSRSVEDIRREAVRLAENGVQEINLVAQDVAAYGRERKGPGRLPLLLETLHRVEGVRWIRLLYCHPSHVDQALVDTLGELEKVCPYLDLPVQHVSKPVLTRMNRAYDIRRLRALIRNLRSARPDLALRTTLMVGFPGETERDVERLLRFLEEVRFHHVGVFPYSPEPETAGRCGRETVPPAHKQDRLRAVMELQAGISASTHATYVGSVQTVLVEGDHREDPALLQARTRYQAPEVDGIVAIRKHPSIAPGLATVRIVRSSTYDLYGKPCAEPSPHTPRSPRRTLP